MHRAIGLVAPSRSCCPDPEQLFSPVLCRDRNAIGHMFGRLKDRHRVATRYDTLAEAVDAAVCFAAIVSYGV